jgi:DNA-binding transcriptional regulator YiaG
MANNKEMSTAGKKILAAMEEPKISEQISINIPELLKKTRESLNMNRSQFAEAFHFTKYSVRNWESGDREPPEYCIAYLKLISRNPWDAYKELNPE